MKIVSFLAALTAVTLPAAALAHDGMHTADAYAISSNGQSAAVFMQLQNHRDVACTLQSVSSDAAKKIELHTSTESDGVMRMGPIAGGIPVAAKSTHDLMRGGDHVMMMGLTQPLTDGDMIHLTLNFGECGTETADVAVDNGRTPGDAPAEAGMDHSGH